MEPKKYIYVDSLRGLAILMVIACHQALYFDGLSAPLQLLASYGQTGVFLFFVVSAFTLCNSMRLREGEDRATRNFFIRRYFRIAPLYYTGIILYIALRIMLPGDRLLGGEQPAQNVVANVALVHGFMPSAFTGIVPGGWSIGTEWAFYLLFPLLFPFCRRMQNSFGWTILLIPTGIVAAASAGLLAQVGMADSGYWFWYDFILNQLPVFMMGVVLFFAVQAGSFQPVMGRDTSAFLLISGAAIWALKMNLFIVLPLMSALSFIFLFNILRNAKAEGLLERIGRASYSMYIFHFVGVLLAAEIVAMIFPAQGIWQNFAYMLTLMLSIAATYAVAKVSERFIEEPFIAYGRKLTKAHTSPSPTHRS